MPNCPVCNPEGMDESRAEEILIKRLEKRQLVNRADLQEVERIANDRGMHRLARRASRERRRLRSSRRSIWQRSDTHR
jgi:hypothetical protein